MSSLLHPELYEIFSKGVNPEVLKLDGVFGNIDFIAKNFFINADLVLSKSQGEYSDKNWISVYKLNNKNSREILDKYFHMGIVLGILEGSCDGCEATQFYIDGDYADVIMSRSYINTMSEVNDYVFDKVYAIGMTIESKEFIEYDYNLPLEDRFNYYFRFEYLETEIDLKPEIYLYHYNYLNNSRFLY